MAIPNLGTVDLEFWSQGQGTILYRYVINQERTPERMPLPQEIPEPVRLPIADGPRSVYSPFVYNNMGWFALAAVLAPVIIIESVPVVVGGGAAAATGTVTTIISGPGSSAAAAGIAVGVGLTQ